MTAVTTPRVGLFGNLGSGNIGNDASMEAVLRYMRSAHPEASVDAMCGGAASITERYGILAIPLDWWSARGQRLTALPAAPLKVLGKLVDVFRTAAWVHRHDVIIVPGMGVLEASLPLRPWGFPYAMFLLCVWGRLLGTPVALISVGAGRINQRMTRVLFDGAAKLAFYRSYRNVGSRVAMKERGLNVTDDPVYPDLAFYLPTPQATPGDAQVVCVGVMDFHGSNDDRPRAKEIYTQHVMATKTLVRWLVDNGYQVRLVVGDTNGSDNAVVDEVLADLRQYWSGPSRFPVTAPPVRSFDDVMHAMQPAGSVIAIRFHNVVAALRLCKPTIAISYSAKHRALMADMGLLEFCRDASPLDVDELIRQFKELQERAPEIRRNLKEPNVRNEHLLAEQFAELSASLFATRRPSVGRSM